MNDKYPSLINTTPLEPDYDCRELKGGNFSLRARCNKNNPDCQKLIEELKKQNDKVEIIALDHMLDGKNMVDVWIRKHNPFSKNDSQ